MKKVLAMTFETTGGKSVTISLDDPKSTIGSEEVKTVMDLIIARNVFETKSGALKTAKYAKIVQSTEQRFKYEEA